MAEKPPPIRAPRYTLWAAALLATLLSAFWLAALGLWHLIGPL